MESARNPDTGHSLALSTSGLHNTVATKLAMIYTTGKLVHSQVAASGALEALKALPMENAMTVLEKVLESRQEHLPDKSLLLWFIIKNNQLNPKSALSGMKIFLDNSDYVSQPGAVVVNWLDLKPPFRGPAHGKIEEILKNHNFKMVIRNGLRKCGPPLNFPATPPSDECEVYCGNISRFAFEDKLIPLFSEIGAIWDIQLMIDSSTHHLHRGFAFVRFTTPASALKAVKELNGRNLMGQDLVVNIPSMRVLVRNVPKSKVVAEIKKEFGNAMDGVADVILNNSPNDRGKNRGSCFVIYDSYQSASLAKQILSGESKMRIYDCDITLDYDVENEPDCKDMSNVKVATFKLI